MTTVEKAIEAGRCSVAVSGALLKDPDVVLALNDRRALKPMVLSGPTGGPVVAVGSKGIARSVAQPGGVLVLVEPERADGPGVGDLGKLLSRAGHKPKIYVVARQYNPFAFGALAGFEIEHIKGRGKNFLRDLPMPPDDMEPVTAELAKKVTKKSAEGSKAPRFCFTGREDEVAALTEMLATGGPIIVSGPHGIGKRAVIEHAVAASERHRYPDLVLGRGVGFDTLAARLAVICEEAGSDTLAKALQKTAATPTELAEAAATSIGATSAEGVMVIEGLHTALGRQGDFFRKSRLELLLQVLLTTASNLRLVFSSLDQPTLYREGASQHLRRLPLEGIKGRFLYEIFEAYKAPEFPRDRMGPISDKIGGHPMAAKVYAIDVRDRPEGIALTEDPKYLKLDDDLDKLKRRLSRYVERLSDEHRVALAVLAHHVEPFDGNTFGAHGINRNTRIDLLGQGVLEQTGTEADRKYRVHPLVRSNLTWRETSDFDVYRGMADQAWADLKGAEGLEKVVLEQKMNLACINSRQIRRKLKTRLPDNDLMVESCIGMIRSRKPNFTLARQRLNEICNAQPGNADAWLLQLELCRAEERFAQGAKRDDKRGRKGKGKEGRGKERNDDRRRDDREAAKPHTPTAKFDEVAEQAIAAAPVPEIFHKVCDYQLFKRQRNKAVETLEAGIAALPEEARLYCRLGSILLRQGRRKDAIDALQKAMELQPMLPDAYGLLGMARRDEGAGALDEAESLLREAVRLAPEDPVQTARLADLLIHRAAAETDTGKRSDGFNEAKELLELSLRGNEKSPEAQLLLATLHRRSGGDLERAEWLLKQAKKNTDRGADRNHRIALERALVVLAKGDLDGAESIARDQVTKNPSSHRAVATLAQILEARDQVIPAHAEFLRALERAPQESLWAKQYEAELERLKARIEAGAAGLATAGSETAPQAAAPAADDREHATGNTAHRVIRRKKKGDEDGEEVVPQGATIEDLPAKAQSAEEPPAGSPSVKGKKLPVPAGEDAEDPALAAKHTPPQVPSEAAPDELPARAQSEDEG